jgi:hypothetical protein
MAAVVVMPSVLVTVSMSCGCTVALVDDDGRLLACSADVCRGHWWCECVDGDLDPEVCAHADALLLVVDAR